MRFELFIPCDILKPFVKTFAIQEADEERSYKVLPDTNIVIGFQYKGRLSLIENNRAGKCGEDIQKLWHDFYELCLILQSPNLINSEIDNFENKAKQWIKLFCRPSQGQLNSALQIPGLYRREDVTPYMHIFSQHIPEFLRNLKEKTLELKLFSTSSIEKKTIIRYVTFIYLFIIYF
jgi:hypothetical protein